MRADVFGIHSLARKGRALVAQMIRQPVAEFAVVLPIEGGCICLTGNRCRRGQSASHCGADPFGGRAPGLAPTGRECGTSTPSVKIIHVAPQISPPEFHSTLPSATPCLAYGPSG